jgi:hypothetical protein
MHNTDGLRTGYGFGRQEAANEFEGEYGFAQELPGTQRLRGNADGAFELGQRQSIFSEMQEMELASQLLEVASEEELEQFLGNLIRSVGRAVGGFVRGPVGRAIGGALKGIARVALPLVGGALGTFVGGPAGTALGGTLAGMAGKALGLELESLSQEERELEVARRVVQIATQATTHALHPVQTFWSIVMPHWCVPVSTDCGSGRSG